jgi:hypothetical protein
MPVVLTKETCGLRMQHTAVLYFGASNLPSALYKPSLQQTVLWTVTVR